MDLSPLGPIKVLVVDDDETVIRTLARTLTDHGIELESSTDAVTTAAKLDARISPWDVVVLDIQMPGISGTELLERFRETGSPSSVIMLSSDATATTATWCIRSGAFHYLPKPWCHSELLSAVQSGAQYSRTRRAALEQTLAAGSRSEILGASVGIRNLRAGIDRVAQQNVSILISGESGTGKELVARLVHERSARAYAPFVALNCGAIPEGLIDSELFGHVKGAFTGATSDRPGVFVEADGGTLFLDEIGDMPMSVQARLLRVLQTGELRSVGGNGTRTVDVRVLAATHVDLREAVEEKLFREDLFYRLNVVTLAIPPLRERLADLPILVARFLEKHGGGTPLTLSSPAIDAMMSYRWPGNVRELENALLQAIALRHGDRIGIESLPERIRERSRGSMRIPLDLEVDGAELSLADARRRVTSTFERTYTLRVMQRAQGSIAKAARMAGMDRTNFRRLLQRLEIDPADFR